jgi:hypothetical protein
MHCLLLRVWPQIHLLLLRVLPRTHFLLLCVLPQMQVLRLARCELHDAGGAVVLSALRSHPCLRELDLSWNALSHGTAKAVEAAFRYDAAK